MIHRNVSTYSGSTVKKNHLNFELLGNTTQEENSSKKSTGTKEQSAQTKTAQPSEREENGKKASAAEIVKNSVYSGLNQFNQGLASTLDFLLPTEFLGKYDVVQDQRLLFRAGGQVQ